MFALFDLSEPRDYWIFSFVRAIQSEVCLDFNWSVAISQLDLVVKRQCDCSFFDTSPIIENSMKRFIQTGYDETVIQQLTKANLMFSVLGMEAVWAALLGLWA